uniref:Uncharacterized protein n=1 Tax=Opuntia streptacantha TaxID=393608 RepID=A0A7C9A6E6_OPUST
MEHHTRCGACEITRKSRTIWHERTWSHAKRIRHWKGIRCRSIWEAINPHHARRKTSHPRHRPHPSTHRKVRGPHHPSTPSPAWNSKPRGLAKTLFFFLLTFFFLFLLFIVIKWNYVWISSSIFHIDSLCLFLLTFGFSST